MAHFDRLDPSRYDLASRAILERLRGGASVSRRTLLQGTAAGAAIAVAGSRGLTVGAQATPAITTPTGEKGGSGTLVVSTSGDPLSFQPNFQADDNGFAACCNIYNSLLSLDGDYNVIPELAQSYETSEDGLSITFNLAPNALWHDGTPVTSADVKYTLEKIVLETGATASELIGAITTVETPDANTAVARLSAPSSSVLGFLGWYGIFILPAHIYEGTDWTTNGANQAPVGCGPFRFASYTPGQAIELDANLDYWGEGPYLDRLIFQIIPDANTAYQALLNGEIDAQVAPSMPNAEIPSAQSNPDLIVAEKAYPSPYYIGFNVTRPTFSTPEVRKAIAQAIDRDQIVATALGGYSAPATTYYPPAIAWASNPEPDAATPALDIDAANAALDAAGFPLNGDTRFSLDFLHFNASPQYVDVSTVIREQLSAIGIDVNLVSLEIGAWAERLEAGDFDMALIGGFQGPDPANLRARIGEGGGVNFWGYVNPEIETLLDEGDQAIGQEARQPFYYEIQRILATDVPIIPLADYIAYIPYGANVSGVNFDPNDPLSLQQGLNRYTLARRAE